MVTARERTRLNLVLGERVEGAAHGRVLG